MIKAIGFDFGGVIAKSRAVMPSISEILSVPIDQLKEIYFQNNYLSNTGLVTYEEMWVAILDKLGKSEKNSEVQNFLKLVNAQWELDQDVLGIIKRLKKTYKTGLLSNANFALADKMRSWGLEEYFDAFVISCEIGFQKPDPESFKMLFERLNVLPQESIFIDDSQQSLRTADAIGYIPVLFEGTNKLKSQLQNLGVYN